MSSIHKLSQNLTDTTQPVATRRAAVLEIAATGDEQALPLLTEALLDSAPGIRREAANALKQYNTPDITPALLNAIKAEDNDLTLWTLIEVLGIIGTEEALTDLKDILSYTISPLTRREIQKSIDQITDRLQDTETVELSDRSTDELDEPIDTTDFREIPHTDNEQLELNQDSVDKSGVEEEEVYTENLSTETDDSLEDDNVSPIIVDENTDSEPIDVEIIDIDASEGIQSEETENDELSVKVVESDEKTSSAETDEEPKTDNTVRTSRTIGSSPILPVLVPNTSVVLYSQEDTTYKPSAFALVLRPTAYLSKQWVSRTRIYFILFCLLMGATFALVYSQVQRQPRSPYVLNEEITYMENPEKYLSAGKFFIQERDYRSAIDTLEFIRGIDVIDPELYDLYWNLGFAYFNENQYALAVEAYEYYFRTRKNETVEPFVAEASYSVDGLNDSMQESTDYMTYIMLGTAYARLGQLNQARNAYETAISLVPNEPDAYSKLAQLYSDGYQQKHLLTEGLAYSAVRRNPDVPFYHNTLGWILGKSGRINRAIQSLEHAIRLQRDYIPAHYHISEIADRNQKTKNGIVSLQNDLLNKMHPTSKSRSAMLNVLSYIYETEAQKIPRFNTSLLRMRGIERK